MKKEETQGLKAEEKELLETIKGQVAEQLKDANATKAEKKALEDLSKLVEETATSKQVAELTQELSDFKAEMEKRNEESNKGEEKTLKNLIEEHSSVLKAIKANKSKKI